MYTVPPSRKAVHPVPLLSASLVPPAREGLCFLKHRDLFLYMLCISQNALLLVGPAGSFDGWDSLQGFRSSDTPRGSQSTIRTLPGSQQSWYHRAQRAQDGHVAQRGAELERSRHSCGTRMRGVDGKVSILSKPRSLCRLPGHHYYTEDKSECETSFRHARLTS